MITPRKSIRISKNLHGRALQCARIVDETLMRFSEIAAIKYKRGDLNSVVIPDNMLFATRKKAIRPTCARCPTSAYQSPTTNGVNTGGATCLAAAIYADA